MIISSKLTIGFSVLLLFLLISPSISSPFPSIKSWCQQTPHPEPCEHFLESNSKQIFIKGKSDFLSISTHLALQRALRAYTHALTLGIKCRNKKEKAAWADCLELYEYTALKINKTINRSAKCTKRDIQTWLSSALTYFETCKHGFIDLGVADYMLPMMTNNVSNLISNTLALNKGPDADSHEPSHKDGFPKWLSRHDRKLLQSFTQAPAAAPAAAVDGAAAPAEAVAAAPAFASDAVDFVVAKDGSGGFTTLGAAVAAAAKRIGAGRLVIYIKAGIYSENVEIGKKLKNIMLIGDGIGKTIITGSKSVGGSGDTTFRSATVAAVGDGFIASGITFRNTAGPTNHQAVAFRSGSDFSVLYRCSFEGYQDTLYVHSQRQFYRECDIYGTVDFIFGNAAVVLQNCNIYPRNPPQRTNTLTAQSRIDPNMNTGISFYNCKVTPSAELVPFLGSTRTYLGRPWKQYSRVVYMKTFLDGFIDPLGWYPWAGDFALNTLYYGEYMNTGPGSSTLNRVKWRGYRGLISATEASKFTVESLLGDTSALVAAKVPFTTGL